MPWTTPRTWTTGELVTKAIMDTHIRDNQLFLYTPPMAHVFNSAGISIPNNSVTALSFDSERYDTDGIHSPTTYPTRLTCNTAGVYLLTANIRWALNANGHRGIFFQLGSGVSFAGNTIVPVPTIPIYQSLAGVYRLAVGDYVEVVVIQTSGAALGVEFTADLSIEATMQWIGG